jgi:hypothetical protein
MKQEVAEIWYQALESGTYKQGRAMLKDPKGRFCCLGVLCDIYLDHISKEWDCIDEGSGKRYLLDNNFASLPPLVQAWAGMKSGDGKYASDKESLMTLNDRRSIFVEIAQIIKENYEKL